jgi:predicted nucleic acid-binding protein
MIVVDSSVWIDHLHKADAHLVGLLENSEVAVHPMVIGELALGSIPGPGKIIDLLSDLPTAEVALHGEVMAFIETHRLYGRGLSLIDAHLLASVLLWPGSTLWTRDKALHAAAVVMNKAHVA